MATNPVFNDVKPFPGKASAPPAVGSVAGHNRPSPANDVLREFADLLSQRDGFDQRCDDLVAASGRAMATNQETAGRCGELIKQIGAAERVINDAHKSAKEPYLEASRAIDGAKKAKLGPLEQAKATVNAKLNTFLREERARVEAEARRAEEERRAKEVEQRRREEEARAANEPAPEPVAEPVAAPAAPEPTRIRGDFGALTTGKTVWVTKVTDYQVAFIAANLDQNEKVREAIDKAIANLVRGGTRKIDGVEIDKDVRASVR